VRDSIVLRRFLFLESRLSPSDTFCIYGLCCAVRPCLNGDVRQ
jgi:hypothetical protein